MVRRAERVNQSSWVDQLLTADQAALVRELFPFKTPPLEVARNCLAITDPQLQLSAGYHETSSNILLLPRADRKLLIPTEAFGRAHPEFDLNVIVTHTLPITHRDSGRRWAVWCSRIPYIESARPRPMGFTPELARAEVARADEIKGIYKKMLAGEGDSALQENLNTLMSQILRGAWFRYYTDSLPKMISENRLDAEKIIAELFKGVEWKIARAIKYWEKLTPEDQKLLANAFRIVVKAKFSPPYAYVGAGADDIRTNTLTESGKQSNARDPLEIVARPQGISIDDIEAVYIPDNAESLIIYPIVRERLKTLGIDGKVRPISELADKSKYPTCDAPYERFNLGLLAQYIYEGWLTPLVPSE